MGSGTHRDGIWELTFRIPPTTLVPDEFWYAAIRAASQRLHEITGGTQAIGQAWLASEFASIATADVLCIEPGIIPNANPGGIGRIGMNVAMSRPDCAGEMDFDWWVRALVHELGHYLFGLGDEVRDGVVPDDRCVMADPSIARWCDQSDHNKDADNSQNRLHHGESCQTVVDRVMGWLPVVPRERAWTRLDRATDQQRFALCDARRLRRTDLHDDGFERAFAICEQIAKFDDLAIRAFRQPSLEITVTLAAAAAWIDGEPRGSAAAILILCETIRDTPELRLALRRCRDHGIRVMVFASQPSDASALDAFAADTLGGFEVLPDSSAADYELQVAMRVVRGFSGLRNGVWLGFFEQAWLEPTGELAWDWEVEDLVERQEILIAVSPGDCVRVTWEAPDGSIGTVPEAKLAPGWSMTSISQPRPGRWRLRVSAPLIDRRIPIAAWSSIKNPAFGISLRGLPAVAKPDATFALFAFAGFSSQRPVRWELRSRGEDPRSPTRLVASRVDGEPAPAPHDTVRGCQWCPPDSLRSNYSGIQENIAADWIGPRDFELVLELRGPNGTRGQRAIPFQLLVSRDADLQES